jgi:hypothetical protein
MPAFTIDPDDHVAVRLLRSQEPLADGFAEFETEKELAALAANWPATRLVAIWNKLPGTVRVAKFTDRKTGVRRIWNSIQKLTPREKPPPPSFGAKGEKTGGRKNTKTEQVIALLKQPSGASLKGIMALTGWQAHSVRGFISGQLSKKMGLRVKSFKRDGERIYRIRS